MIEKRLRRSSDIIEEGKSEEEKVPQNEERRSKKLRVGVPVERLTQKQIFVLKKYRRQKKMWSQELICAISKELGVAYRKVYKWQWE